MAEDYYDVLDVSRQASQAEIEKAYRDLARKYHPDLNPDDKTAKEKFQKVQTAFDVLNDAEKRENYDRYGASFESMGAGGPGQQTGWAGPGGFENFDFSQVFGGGGAGRGGAAGFEDIFRGAAGGGQRARPQRPRRGSDIHHELKIPFATSVLGGEAQLRMRRTSGDMETINVRIPVGIEDSKKIRLRGQGETSSSGGEPGDILITILVSPHPYFTRTGTSLVVKVPVTITEAIHGGTINIPSPEGTIEMKLPPGTSSGAKLRVRGHGVKINGATPGDLFAEIQIVLPETLTAESLDDDTKAALEHLASQYPESPRDKLAW